MNNNDLIRAVLALAAYEKTGTEDYDFLATIGNADRLSGETQTLPDGFAAVVYEMGNKYIISYRGTDNWQDVPFGWSCGDFSPIISAQSYGAVSFIKRFVANQAAINPG